MYLRKIYSDDTGIQEYLGCTDEEYTYMDLELMQQIQEKEGGSIYTVACFSELMAERFFTPFDGDGFYHNGYGRTNISVWDKEAVNNTANVFLYVCWYNRSNQDEQE